MRAGAIVLAAASLLAMPAIAQPPLGSRLDPAPGAVRPQDSLDRVTGRRVMRTFAGCLLRNKPRIAAEIMAEPFGSETQAAVVQRRVAGINDCMGATGLSMGFSVRALAGALAEAELGNRFATTDLARVARLTGDDITVLSLTPRNGSEELGLCVVRRAPEAVRTWALSEPGSAAETAARRIAVDQVGPCVDQGQPLRADIDGLRAILSAALYRALWRTRP